MGAGWLYYHKYPPKRKCSLCGKRHSMVRIAVASNGEDFWELRCTNRNPPVKKFFEPHRYDPNKKQKQGIVTPLYEEGK